MRKLLTLMNSTRARLVLVLLIALFIELILRLGVAEIEVTYFINDSNVPGPSGREISFYDPNGKLLDRQISGTIILRSAMPAFLMDVMIGVDDCLPEFIIPSLSYSLPGPPYCDYHRPLVIPELATRLKPGIPYRYFARVTNFGGPGRFAITFVQSPIIYAVRVISCTTFIVTLACLIFGFKKRDKGLLVALALGTYVRVAYFFSNELGVRSADFGAHVEYVNHVLTFGNVPHPAMGWEYHQPPLYYFTLAGLIRIYCALTGMPIDVPLIGRGLSFIFSCITLTFILRAVTLLPLPAARAKTWINLLMVVVATYPNLVFCTMALNNDIMLFSVVSYTLFLIFRAIIEGDHPSLLVKILTSVGAILIKANGVVVVLFWVLTDFFASGPIKRSERLKSTAIMVFVFIFVAVAQVSFRYEQNFVLSPFYRESIGLGDVQKLESTWRNFLTFNPIRVFYDTYVEIWNESRHRSFFWEHFFRNFIFGEYNHGAYVLSLSRLLLLLWMGIFSVIFVQMILAPMTRICSLILLLLGITFVMFISFRLSFPYACHQDARFLPPLFCLLPVLIAERMAAFYRKYGPVYPRMEEAVIPFWEAALGGVIVVQVAFLMWL